MDVLMVQLKKKELESSLLKALQDFENETDCKVENIDIRIVHAEYGKSFITALEITVEL